MDDAAAAFRASNAANYPWNVPLFVLCATLGHTRQCSVCSAHTSPTIGHYSTPLHTTIYFTILHSIFQLIIRKDQKPLLQPTNTSSIPQSILQSQLSWPYMFSQSVNISSITQSAHQMLNNPPFPFHQLFPLASEHMQSWLSSDQVSCQRRRQLRHLT